MAKFKIYKLHFTSPLHIGDNRDDYGISQKIISSDTFYAALTACLAKLGEQIPEDGFLGCTISSLFPYYQKDKNSDVVYFFPSPLLQPMPKLKDLGKAKKVKKVKWIDISYFEQILKGKELFDGSEDVVESVQGEYLTTRKINSKFINSQVTQRVTISREFGKDAVPFYMDKIFFEGESGLFFIVDGNTSLLDKAMTLLASEGIGTDRNVGNGFFEYAADEIEVKLPAASDHALSLSLFFPETKEQVCEMLEGTDVAYNFERRGGWITTYPYQTLRKNVIHGLTPGSVVKKAMNGSMQMGRIVDLAPQTELGPKHPVWRCGKSIFLPIIIK